MTANSPATPARPLSALIRDYLPDWRSLAWPLDWDAEFGRVAPRTVEIGFGNGEFLVAMARSRPEEDFLGIELAWGSVARLLRRVEDASLDNVRVLQGNGAYLLERLFPPESLVRVVANNSDPWPKERHYGRRLIQSGFLATVATRLTPGGSVLIATDHGEYADWIETRLREQSRLAPIDGTVRSHHRPEFPITRYQAKALEAGIPINFFEWGKPADAPPEPLAPLPEKEAMPNVLLEGSPGDGPLVPGSGPDVYAESHQGADVLIKLLHRYHRDEGDWLVEALTVEDGFSQRFGILVSPREDNRLVVRLAELGTPRPTWGVKRAVNQVAELLLRAHPEIRILGSTVGTLTDPVD